MRYRRKSCQCVERKRIHIVFILQKSLCPRFYTTCRKTLWTCSNSTAIFAFSVWPTGTKHIYCHSCAAQTICQLWMLHSGFISFSLKKGLGRPLERPFWHYQSGTPQSAQVWCIKKTLATCALSLFKEINRVLFYHCYSLFFKPVSPDITPFVHKITKRVDKVTSDLTLSAGFSLSLLNVSIFPLTFNILSLTFNYIKFKY